MVGINDLPASVLRNIARCLGEGAQGRFGRLQTRRDLARTARVCRSLNAPCQEELWDSLTLLIDENKFSKFQLAGFLASDDTAQRIRRTKHLHLLGCSSTTDVQTVLDKCAGGLKSLELETIGWDAVCLEPEVLCHPSLAGLTSLNLARVTFSLFDEEETPLNLPFHLRELEVNLGCVGFDPFPVDILDLLFTQSQSTLTTGIFTFYAGEPGNDGRFFRVFRKIAPRLTELRVRQLDTLVEWVQWDGAGASKIVSFISTFSNLKTLECDLIDVPLLEKISIQLEDLKLETNEELRNKTIRKKYVERVSLLEKFLLQWPNLKRLEMDYEKKDMGKALLKLAVTCEIRGVELVWSGRKRPDVEDLVWFEKKLKAAKK